MMDRVNLIDLFLFKHPFAILKFSGICIYIKVQGKFSALSGNKLFGIFIHTI